MERDPRDEFEYDDEDQQPFGLALITFAGLVLWALLLWGVVEWLSS